MGDLTNEEMASARSNYRMATDHGDAAVSRRQAAMDLLRHIPALLDMAERCAKAEAERDKAMAMLKDTVGEILEATDNQVTLDGDQVVIADYAKAMRDLREQRDAKHNEVCDLMKAAGEAVKLLMDAVHCDTDYVSGHDTIKVNFDHFHRLCIARNAAIRILQPKPAGGAAP